MIASTIAHAETAQPRAAYRAQRRARAKLWDKIATIGLWSVAAFITGVFVFIVGYTLVRGLPSVVRPGFLTSGDPQVGIAAQIYNTFYLLLLSLLIMLPVGVGTAIYVVEYARHERFLRILRFATETLTSTPTLIIGLLGFLIFTANVPILHLGPFTIRGFGFGFTRLSGALTLAVLNVPWMLRTAEDALRAVPRELREASLALGATKWQTVTRAVLPAAIPGLITSMLVVAGRVTGETAALIYTVGAGGSSQSFANPALNRPGETLAYHAYQLFAEPSANSEQLRLGTALVLIVLVLAFNIVARLLGEYLNRRLIGKSA